MSTRKGPRTSDSRFRAALDLRRKRLESAAPPPTQMEWAVKLGVDLGRYNAFEKGRARPGLDMAVKMEHELGIPVEAWTEEVGAREWERASKDLDALQEQVRAAS